MMKHKDNFIMYIDLKNKDVRKVPITLELRKKYIGGIGINTKILLDSDAVKYDPLSEKNILIFGVGPAVGTGLLAGNRCTITAKGPLTGFYGDSNVGGEFNLKMRSIGIDHLVFTGKAETPVYVLIDENCEVSIIKANDLWGLRTDEVTEILMERHGPECDVACIGPAGENLVRFASVIMSKCHAAGKTGMGCIMGSKNLKAVVVKSGKGISVPVFDKEKIDYYRKLWIKKCCSSAISKLGNQEGTLFLVERYNQAKHLPVNNCQALHSEKAKNIYSQIFKYKYQKRKKACFACPVGCAKEYEINDGNYAGEKGDRIDYGTVAGLGSNLGIFDWGSILHLKMLCDYLGMDTIETGSVIGLLIECYQRGLITKEEVDGLDLEFGNSEQVETLIYKIANREGIGNILAEGTYRAGVQLKAEKYAFCIKKVGTGLLSKDRVAWSLGYLTSTRGGDHLKNFPFTMIVGGYFSKLVAKYIFRVNAAKAISTTQKKGRVVWWHENYKYIVDALGICIFAIHGLPNTGHAFFDDFATIMNALFNLSLTEEDVFYAADRIYQLQNAFNVMSGLTIEDYKWPRRVRDEDIDEELVKESTMMDPNTPGLLPEYFYYRGLTKDGKPTYQRFQELGLEDYLQKIDVVNAIGIPLISNLVKDVDLKAKFSLADRIKSSLISSLFIRLLDLKDKKERKEFMKSLNNELSSLTKEGGSI